MDKEIFKNTVEINDELVKITKQAEYTFHNNLPGYIKDLVDMTQTVYSYNDGLLLYLSINTGDVKTVTDYFDLRYNGYDDLIKDYNTVSHVGIKYNRIINYL